MNCFKASAHLALAILVLTAVSPASAETKKELVAKVVQAQMADVESIARLMTNQSMQPFLQGAGKAIAGAPQDKREALAKSAEAEMRKTGSEIEQLLLDRARKLASGAIGPVLEEKLTEDELRQTVAWLDSPAARKMRQLGPEIQNALAQKLIAESKGSIEPKLKALDEKLRGVFGAGTGAAAPAKN